MSPAVYDRSRVTPGISECSLGARKRMIGVPVTSELDISGVGVEATALVAMLLGVIVPMIAFCLLSCRYQEEMAPSSVVVLLRDLSSGVRSPIRHSAG